MEIMQHVTDASFDPVVLKCDIPVLTLFTAQWSPAGKIAGVQLTEFAATYRPKLKVAALDINANPVITSKYGVLSVPTFILFKNGQEVQRTAGEITATQITPFLDE